MSGGKLNLVSAFCFTGEVLLLAAQPAQSAIPKPTDGPRYLSMLVKQNALVTDCQTAAANAKDIISLDDIEAGISRTSKAPFNGTTVVKGEYETSDAFEERFDKTISRYFGNTSRAAFKVKVPDNLVSYNADTAILTIQLYSRGSFQSTLDPVFLKWTIGERTVDRGTGYAQTMLGIKFSYSKSSSYVRRILLQFPFQGSNITDEVQIPVPPAQAAALKTNLRLVTFGSLFAPYKGTEEFSGEATLIDRYESYQKTDTYYTTPKCLFLINASSGEVYKTYAPKLDSAN